MSDVQNVSRYDVVVVGAGQAGVQAVATLVNEGFSGSIALLSSENVLPYERPPLSKGYFSGEQTFDDITLRAEHYWADSPVDLLLDHRVTSVDPVGQTVRTAQGNEVGYGRLVWAAGGRARTLPIPGHELTGVYTVRNLSDADALRAAAVTATGAVIIGGGYIGLEAASALRKLGIAVTIVEAADRLLGRVTGVEMSEYYRRLHEANGVRVLLGAGVMQITGNEGRVTGVELATGEVVPAQIVIVGVGIIPNVEPLAEAGAVVSNGVDVDELCRTSLPHVWAIGDLANHFNPFAGGRIRIEAVQNASEQARVAVGDLLGRGEAYSAVPWFWSNQYEAKLKTAGLLGGYTDVVLRGSIDDGRFSVIYLRDGVLLAIDCVNRPRDFTEGRELLGQGVTLDSAAAADVTRSLRDAAVATAAA